MGLSCRSTPRSRSTRRTRFEACWPSSTASWPSRQIVSGHKSGEEFRASPTPPKTCKWTPISMSFDLLKFPVHIFHSMFLLTYMMLLTPFVKIPNMSLNLMQNGQSFFRIDMHSLIFNSRSGRILMGGMQNKLVEIDLATGKETRVRRVSFNSWFY